MISSEPILPRITVAVSTFRRPAGLRRLLETLRPQLHGRPSRELVIVNDGSHDEAYDTVVREFADIVSYCPLPQNVGIARARNELAARARGSYIVYTDDDCETPPFWLDWLEARLDANPEIDVLIGTTRPNMPARPRFFERVNAHYRLIPHPHGAPDVPLFVTANVAIRRALFERLGGFKFLAIHGAGEDTELASRLAIAGARSVVDLNWYVMHEVSDGLVRQMRRFWRYGYANVQMQRLTTAPSAHARLVFAHRLGHASNLIEELREHLAMSEGFSRWAPVRWCSAIAASLVFAAHYDGCAAAAAVRRRELRS